MPLITMPDLLTMLKSSAVAGSPLYLQLDRLRQAVEQDAKQYCKWPLEANNGVGQGNWYEIFDGKNYPDLILRKPFVADVSALYLDMLAYGGQNTANGYVPYSSNTLLTAGTNYMLNVEQLGLAKCGTVRFLGNTNNNVALWPSSWFLGGRPYITYQGPPGWPGGYGNIKVVYDWGFQPSTPILTLTWLSGTATMTFASGVVCWPGQQFQIVGGVWGSTLGKSHYVSSVSADFKTVTFLSDNDGVFDTGNADFVPLPIKLAIAEAVSLERNQVVYGGPVTSETLGDYNYSLTLRHRWQALNSYRDTSMAIALF